METIVIQKQKRPKPKKKVVRMDIIEQLERSFQDMREGKIREWKD